MDELKRLQDALESARKKLMVAGKGKRGNAGGEAEYAAAYDALCKAFPKTYRPLRGKYRNH